MAAVTRQHTQRCLCPRTTIQYQVKSTLSIISLTGLFTQEHFCSRFLYYFCLCKSFKELFLKCQRKKMRESGCKGTTNFNTLQILSQLFKSFNEFYRIRGQKR